MDTIGIDFGTTNTVLATRRDGGEAVAWRFSHDDQPFEAFRTTLAFRRNPASVAAPSCEAGPWAIRHFIDQPEDTRFLQSFKSFAASPLFTDTAIFSRRFAFEDLLAAFIDRVRFHAGRESFPRRAVVGRPVKFAGANPDDSLAAKRYGAAFARLGFDEVTYVLEPVAAAWFYAQRLTRTSTILVGDFGGGTSDFTIMRFHVTPAGVQAKALGQSGVGIAGDQFDYRIIDAVVSPRLGKHAVYTSWGKTLPVPVHYFANFSRWNELCLMNRPDVIRELRTLARASPQAGQLEALIDLIEGGVSYELYRTVSQVKAELSAKPEARFCFRSHGVNIESTVKRSDFERWIEADLARIAAAVDEVLAETGLAANEVDRVFLTGGTSYVPAVRRMFVERFGEPKVETGDQLLSIAKGLALIDTAG